MEHAHDHAQPFPVAAENLLLDLARRARASKLEALADGEINGDISEIKARLGDAYPALSASQEAGVAAAFAAEGDGLPTTHPRFEHSHAHHDDEGCTKTHGPMRRVFDSFEHAVLGRVRNHRVKLVAALAFRGSALAICPGDDIAAIGLQLYGAFTGHTGHEHITAEQQAILPRKPYIVLRMGELSLDAPLDEFDSFSGHINGD